MGIFWGKIGIAAVLTATFGGLVALSTGTLLFLSLTSAFEATRNTLAARLETLINDAALESLNFFQPLEFQAKWLAEEIVAGRIDPKQNDAFSAVLNGATSTLPQISAISYQYPDGSGFFYESKTDTLHTVDWPDAWQVRLNQSPDNPQTRPRGNGVWVLRPSVLNGEPTSTFIYPTRTPDGDLGVIAVRVDLNPLSKALASNATYRGYELVRFMLFDNRVVVGHPLLQSIDNANRPTITNIADPYLNEFNTGERYDLAIVADIDDVDTFVLDIEAGERVFAVMTDDSRVLGGGVISIGVHFDPAAGSTEFNRLLTVAIVGVLLLVGSVVIAFFLGRRAAAPMEQLAHAAQLVESNQLEEVERLPVSSVKELAAATTAFNSMVDGLKERVKIRDLFGKYVPQDVANLLLSDDTTAEPKNAEATVLFLDIVGFSSISERLPPAQVVATMNAFFSDAVDIIETEEGMVTQFQGDAILAVFNVPIPKEDHAAAAVRSARKIFEKIRKTKYEKQTLNCRIGVNTGPLVAGAIGAEDRLSYTVYGDAVNVAARLEQMNKEYGTNILIAEATVKQVVDINFEKIGTAPIRGRETPVEVFTLKD